VDNCLGKTVSMVSIGGVTHVGEDDRPERFTTARLVLRKLTPDDVDAMIAIHADPDVVRFRPEGVSTPDDSRQLFASWLDHWDEFGFGYWAIELARTGELIGFGGLQLSYSDDGPYLNVFYRLFSRYWGRGFAPEMVTAALGWGRRAFPDLPMMIITPTLNVPAQRVAIKLGFTEVRRAWFQGTLCCFFRHPDE
jgi:RimJ/RimL family protein N-acetyltransferase